VLKRRKAFLAIVCFSCGWPTIAQFRRPGIHNSFIKLTHWWAPILWGNPVRVTWRVNPRSPRPRASSSCTREAEWPDTTNSRKHRKDNYELHWQWPALIGQFKWWRCMPASPRLFTATPKDILGPCQPDNPSSSRCDFDTMDVPNVR